MIRFLIEKEFKQIFRNKLMPGMILGMTIMMMIVMPWASNQEVKDLHLTVVDHDHSSYSQRLIQKITASSYFFLTEMAAANEEAMQDIEAGKSDLILEIEPDFEKNLIMSGGAQVMISANAVNGIKGGLGSSYLSNIINDFATEVRNEQYPSSGKEILPVIGILPQYRFNPHLDYKVFMVPALMVILLTLLCGFLPSLNIVSEKEIGTIEQINVTPVSKFTFIMGKLIPYWVIGFVCLTLCFILAALIYKIYPVGNLLIIYLFASIYILIMSGFGLIISNYSATMQQAMFVMFFFMMILMLMSGLFTPISSMPKWAQYITYFNPLRYFMQIMRMVYLKGSSAAQLVPQMIALCIFAFVCNLWAVLSYQKKS